jgi:uncharacterized glyoxalase superfamily metalloenzyme YdcJ
MNTKLADKIDMQNRLFAELSRMFASEVPLYDKSLLVNRECNKVVCGLLGQLHTGFAINDAQIDKTSGERHGAIRIGRADEYRLITRFFACFGMEPHNFYNMADVGAKSQPIIATAFRSVLNPEHRVFTSLLQTDYFDPATRGRIEALLAQRQIFSDKAKSLLDKNERDGGLDWNDANELIREGTDRIFKWTGRARDYQLYDDLCKAGFKIAADIACFESHHLNHLTPNTFCMDLYTFAMKFCMGEVDAATFKARAHVALSRLAARGDLDFMRLCFKHLTAAEILGFGRGGVTADAIGAMVEGLAARLQQKDLVMASLKHSGFKDTTEGPSEDTPVLLRQDSYKALTEPVQFRNADGTTFDTVHTARFGEIEQRFYATTPKGRSLYDACLSEAELAKEKDPGLAKRDFVAYETAYAKPFAPFPKTLAELLERGLVFGRYVPTSKGLSAKGTLTTTNILELVRQGCVAYEGLRYEDFLPVSAAGIFASNLNQYGTKSTAAARPVYTQAMLENVMGKKVIDADAITRGLEAASLLETYSRLDLIAKLPTEERRGLERATESLAKAAAGPVGTNHVPAMA